MYIERLIVLIKGPLCEPQWPLMVEWLNAEYLKVNPRLLMSHSVSHLPSISCDVRVTSQLIDSDQILGYCRNMEAQYGRLRLLDPLFM